MSQSSVLTRLFSRDCLFRAQLDTRSRHDGQHSPLHSTVRLKQWRQTECLHGIVTGSSSISKQTGHRASSRVRQRTRRWLETAPGLALACCPSLLTDPAHPAAAIFSCFSTCTVWKQTPPLFFASGTVSDSRFYFLFKMWRFLTKSLSSVHSYKSLQYSLQFMEYSKVFTSIGLRVVKKKKKSLEFKLKV